MIVGMSLESFIGVSWSRPLSAAASPASAASSIRAASPPSGSRCSPCGRIGGHRQPFVKPTPTGRMVLDAAYIAGGTASATFRLRGRGRGAPDRPHDSHYGVTRTYGAQAHVLLERESGARAGLSLASSGQGVREQRTILRRVVAMHRREHSGTYSTFHGRRQKPTLAGESAAGMPGRCAEGEIRKIDTKLSLFLDDDPLRAFHFGGVARTRVRCRQFAIGPVHSLPLPCPNRPSSPPPAQLRLHGTLVWHALW